MTERKTDPKRIASLIEIAEDPRSPLRGLALVELGDTNHRDAVRTLINVLRNSHELPQFRATAAMGLGKLGHRYEIAIDPLIKSLNSDSWQVRWHSAGALGEIGHLRAVPRLVKTLDDHEADVRIRGAQALHKLFQRSVRYNLGHPYAKALKVVFPQFEKHLDEADANTHGEMRRRLEEELAFAERREERQSESGRLPKAPNRRWKPQRGKGDKPPSEGGRPDQSNRLKGRGRD